jgi:hypothetical protein
VLSCDVELIDLPYSVAEREDEEPPFADSDPVE